MSVNTNYQIRKPDLKLSKNPVLDNSRRLFDRFTNPNGSFSGSSTKETMTAFFNNLVYRFAHNGYEMPCHSAAFLGQLMDPKGKLKAVIDQGKILHIHGNCTVDEAQIILYSDTCHPDKHQKSDRGEAANALKGKENIYLCEASPSNRIEFSDKDIAASFAPNLVINRTTDRFSGWEDKDLYAVSKRLTAEALQQISKGGTEEAAGWKKLDKVVGELARQRTGALWENTHDKWRYNQKATIHVFGGQEHTGDKWLQEQLINRGLRFVEITFFEYLPLTEELQNEYYKKN